MRIPDLNRKRITEKKKTVIGNKEVTQFNKQYPEHGRVTKTEIIKAIRKFNENIALETTINQVGVTLPNNIGILFINNMGKSNSLSKDYKLSIETGKDVYHRNWDTDNNKMRIIYMNDGARNNIKHSNLYTFQPIQGFRRMASKYFRKNWQRCLSIKIDSLRTIK